MPIVPFFELAILFPNRLETLVGDPDPSALELLNVSRTRRDGNYQTAYGRKHVGPFEIFRSMRLWQIQI